MTTETITVAVTQAAQQTMKKYEPDLKEYLGTMCASDAQTSVDLLEATIHSVLQLLALGTADIVVKAFSYAFNMEDEATASSLAYQQNKAG